MYVLLPIRFGSIQYRLLFASIPHQYSRNRITTFGFVRARAFEYCHPNCHNIYIWSSDTKHTRSLILAIVHMVTFLSSPRHIYHIHRYIHTLARSLALIARMIHEHSIVRFHLLFAFYHCQFFTRPYFSNRFSNPL